MDIQTRKIHFVQELLRLKNKDVIGKFEKILREEKLKDYEKVLEPRSMDDFNQMIGNSEERFKQWTANI